MIDSGSHDSEQPSDWVRRFAPLISAGATVLDVACGSGRHARYLASLGLKVEAVDRDAELLRQLRNVSGVTVRCADLENSPWPYDACFFDGVVVTNYLHRPLFEHVLNALKPGRGVLIYETFAAGNERYGRPTNPDFLLRRGELLEVCRARLRVVAYEDLEVDRPKRAMVQRICAVADNVNRDDVA